MNNLTGGRIPLALASGYKQEGQPLRDDEKYRENTEALAQMVPQGSGDVPSLKVSKCSRVRAAPSPTSLNSWRVVEGHISRVAVESGAGASLPPKAPNRRGNPDARPKPHRVSKPDAAFIESLSPWAYGAPLAGRSTNGTSLTRTAQGDFF